MELKEAIEILKKHQNWRLGFSEDMVPPIKVSKALTIAIKKLEEL